MKYRSIFKIMTLVTYLGSGVTVGQAPSHQEFKTIQISLQRLYNVNTNEFHQFWQPGQGLGLTVTFPFYRGQFMAEMNRFQFQGRFPAITDFQAFQIYAGWGQTVTILPRIKWLNGITLGNNFMVFDQGDASRGVKTESEFGLTLVSRIGFLIRSNWSVEAIIHRQFLFTSKPIKLTFAALAFSYSLNTPHWLEEFLR